MREKKRGLATVYGIGVRRTRMIARFDQYAFRDKLETTRLTVEAPSPV
jgi:hypothetical protein